MKGLIAAFLGAGILVGLLFNRSASEKCKRVRFSDNINEIRGKHISLCDVVNRYGKG